MYEVHYVKVCRTCEGTGKQTYAGGFKLRCEVCQGEPKKVLQIIRVEPKIGRKLRLSIDTKEES